MIISASRRTDIPAFFSDWLFQRIEEGYVLVRNPMNFHQVSRISLSPDVVDCIVFWSKNPRPMLHKLGNLGKYMYYFQYTLNGYGTDIERNLPSLEDRIRTFRELSERLGRQRMIWRYDPVLLNERYTIGWHVERYAYIAKELSASTDKCIISFIDLYPGMKRRIKDRNVYELHTEEKRRIAREFSSVANAYGFSIDTCAEDIDLSEFSVGHAHCIDAGLISGLLGCSIDAGKDRAQRPECGCAPGIDIGLYNTCPNGCVYCYANHNDNLERQSFRAYDVNSPLLCGRLTELDKVTERKVKSLKEYRNYELPLYLSNEGMKD